MTFVSTASASRWRRKKLSDSPLTGPLFSPRCLLGIGLLGLLLLACTGLASPSPPAAVRIPTATATPPAATPTLRLTPTPPPPAPSDLADSGWQPLAPGLEKRTVRFLSAEDGNPREGLLQENVTILRIDPALYHFAVGYSPGEPRTMRDWLVENEVDVVVNGGFFTVDWFATGLVIDDGQVSGRSYGSFAGMITIDEGSPDLRWLGERPYDPNSRMEEGLQSFPMLVFPGGRQAILAELADDRPDRRTAIGRDDSGRILLFIAPRGGFTLQAFSSFLSEGEFGLELAFNLDGGTSSGLLWRENGELTGIPSFSPIPLVLLIRRR